MLILNDDPANKLMAVGVLIFIMSFTKLKDTQRQPLMAKAGTEITSTSYIDHHLTNLICGKTDKGWTCDPYLADQMGFWSFHVDSLGWSVFLGLVLWACSNWVHQDYLRRRQAAYKIL